MSQPKSNSFELIEKHANLLLKKSAAKFLLVCNNSGEMIIRLNLDENSHITDRLAALGAELGATIKNLSKAIRNREPESVEIYFDDEIISLIQLQDFVVILGHPKESVKKNLVSLYAKSLNQLVDILQEELT
jgi:hypothetical protein